MTPETLPTPAEAPILDLAMIPLQPAGNRASHRWAVYCTNETRTDAAGYVSRGPFTLWGPYIAPETSDKVRKAAAAKTWPRMVYHPRRENGPDYPAFHFVLPFGPGAWGRQQHLERFAWEIARRTGRYVRLSALTGWHPDTASAGPDDAEPPALD
jgi:hypothetical protein